MLKEILAGLMRRYQQRVPDVAAVINAMTAEGIVKKAGDIENDHIAFRTMGVPQLGVQSLEKIFLHYGYTKMDHYHFPAKQLDAWWYAPPAPEYPRIFISELRVNDLSPAAQAVIHSYTAEVKTDPVNALNLGDGGSCGCLPSQRTLENPYSGGLPATGCGKRICRMGDL